MINIKSSNDLNLKDINMCGSTMSVLQSDEWGIAKSAQGWDYCSYYFFDNQRNIGKAMVLVKTVSKIVGKIAFIPFGPSIEKEYMNCLEQITFLLFSKLQSQHVVLLKVHPYFDITICNNTKLIKTEKLLYTETFVVDLSKDEATLNMNLHKKLRNEVRKAQKLGTQIVIDNTICGLKDFYNMHCETFRRTNYKTQNYELFVNVYEELVSKGKADIRFAEINGKRISSALLLKNDKTCLYMWGASISDRAYNKYEGQKYLIWKSILDSKNLGLLYFDLGGVTVGAEKGSKKDGIYTFKSRFGGKLEQLPGTFEIYSGITGRLVSKLLASYLKMKEKNGK